MVGKKTNRLIQEKSPYLLQHAENPVDWYPWSREAFQRAKEEDKPVLVSIGYSSCHWCHVMERESYEDEETAEVMNENFINIKVDREERPDLDSLYMKAVQALAGHAGWPLNVFTTPEGEPFYGGTYFPPEDRMGLPSFRKVLLTIRDAYREARGHVAEVTQELTKALGQEPVTAPIELSPGVPEYAFQAGKFFFDPINGGFGAGMKFPHAMYLKFLLCFYRRTGERDALSMVEKTLGAMARGGIYDHLGGGFHRYSVDEQWDVPHFEKMLYDNALLIDVYSVAKGVTGKESYGETALGVTGYMLGNLRSPEGGFYSAEDADVDGAEGECYVWGYGEVAKILGEERGRKFAEYFSMTEEGNFEGKNTLRLNPHVKDEDAPSGDELKAMKELLLKARKEKKTPEMDRKIIASWNGLAIEALVSAGKNLGRPELAEEAKKTASFILENLRDERGRLFRYYLGGRSSSRGNLEDYSILGAALCALVEQGEKSFLKDAERLSSSMTELFYDSNKKLFFDAGTDQEKLFVRERDLSDSDIPSGNAAAADFLLRLSALTGRKELKDLSEEILRSIGGMKEEPLSHGHALTVLEALLGGK